VPLFDRYPGDLASELRSAVQYGNSARKSFSRSCGTIRVRIPTKRSLVALVLSYYLACVHLPAAHEYGSRSLAGWQAAPDADGVVAVLNGALCVSRIAEQDAVPPEQLAMSCSKTPVVADSPWRRPPTATRRRPNACAEQFVAPRSRTAHGHESWPSSCSCLWLLPPVLILRVGDRPNAPRRTQP
jgi:hypothetical protein